MEIVSGRIQDVNEDGMTIFVPYTDIERLCVRQYADVQVALVDGRHITPDQRKIAWALMTEIGDYMGHYGNSEIYHYVYQVHRKIFAAERVDTLTVEDFHLSTTDVTSAAGFIDHLIGFMIQEDIPSKLALYEHADDIGAYVYQCLVNHKCAVCGSKADLHHVDKVGMGRNRYQIPQICMRVLPLCRKHHQQDHDIGEADFYDLYKLTPIKLNQETARKCAKMYHFTEQNIQDSEIIKQGGDR